MRGIIIPFDGTPDDRETAARAFEAGDYATALRVFSREHEEYPMDDGRALDVAQSLWAGGDYSRAHQAMRLLSHYTTQPIHADVCFGLGFTAYHLRNYPLAREYLTTYLSIPGPCEYEGEAKDFLEEVNEELAICDMPDLALRWMEDAEQAHVDGDLERLLTLYTQVAELCIDNLDLHEDLLKGLLQHHYPELVLRLIAALEPTAPRSAIYNIFRAKALMLLGQDPSDALHKAGELALREGIEEQEQCLRLWCLSNNQEQALAFAQRANLHKLVRRDILHMIACCHFFLGDPAQAIAHWQIIVNTDAGDVVAGQLIAMVKSGVLCDIALEFALVPSMAKPLTTQILDALTHADAAKDFAMWSVFRARVRWLACHGSTQAARRRAVEFLLAQGGDERALYILWELIVDPNVSDKHRTWTAEQLTAAYPNTPLLWFSPDNQTTIFPPSAKVQRSQLSPAMARRMSGNIWPSGGQRLDDLFHSMATDDEDQQAALSVALFIYAAQRGGMDELADGLLSQAPGEVLELYTTISQLLQSEDPT